MFESRLLADSIEVVPYSNFCTGAPARPDALFNAYTTETEMTIHEFAWIRKAALAVGAALMLAAPAFADEVAEVSSLLRAKQFSEALAKADAYLAERADDPQMRFLKGLVLSSMDRREDAIALFSKLSADYPALPEPYNNLAVLYAAGGQYDKARAALENAVKANPNYARAHENLADVYAQLADQSYAAMLQIEPDNATVRAKQALIRSAIGYRPGAATMTAAAPAAAAAAAAATDTAQRTAPAEPAAAAQEEVLAALDAWAKAWSARDVGAYLDFYSTDFRIPGRQSRARWEAQRRARIEDKSFIEVQVLSPEIVVAGDTATAKFQQAYKSDRFSDSDRKTLTWKKQDGNWKIVREQ